ncbi:hypothetical protein [Poseidonocella sedimentorum]|uniref:Uncharacterized protein n=1 Tax=Poseidonocella sedimentorum TaxID=871652 RepID=A0A1I6EC95_9RHOB|nr:hypothetical protein [Poseidonocella sedimentorum]SFR15118.1 hypothetical protein SAMN04515673_10984 [Poseidonocella sedimentorum]
MLTPGKPAPFRTIFKLGDTEEEQLRTSLAAWNTLLNQIEATWPHTIILSAELFQRPWRPETADHIVETLTSIADTITVVSYLRAPDARFRAALQQHVRFRPGVKKVDGLSYKPSLLPFMGRDGVKVCAHVFERQSLVEGYIVADFCQRHLPEIGPSDLIRLPADANESISPEAMSLLQSLNEGDLRILNGTPSKIMRVIQEADYSTPGFTRPALRPGIATAVHSDCSDLDWLKATFGITFTPPRDENAPRIDLEDLVRVEDFCSVDPVRRRKLWRTARWIAFRKYSWLGKRLPAAPSRRTQGARQSR